jgi:hypothetical protein
LSERPSLKNGGSPITDADIAELNRHLLPTLPLELRVIASNVINFGQESLQKGSRWFMKRASDGRITAAVMNDLRDNYVRFFCRPDEIEELFEEALNVEADGHYFGAAPEAQVPFLEACIRKHRYTSRNWFEMYDMIVLKDYDKFHQAYKALPKLADHFVGDSLKYPEDAEYIDRSWTYHSAHSFIIFAESIYSRPSVCIRDPQHVGVKIDPTFAITNDLAGWEICRSDYSLGSLKVHEPYRMQGLGKWLSSELTFKIISQPLSPAAVGVACFPHPQPIAFVDSSNVASFKLHDQLGYEKGPSFGWARVNKIGIDGAHDII